MDDIFIERPGCSVKRGKVCVGEQLTLKRATD